MRRTAGMLVVLLAFVPSRMQAEPGVCASCQAKNETAAKQILGPCEMPRRLAGLWKVSLCIEVNCTDTGHTWLRYENVETGEVHTVGRYMKGRGGARGVDSGELIYPPAPISGVIYDLDLKREPRVRAGEIHRISVTVRDPVVYRGWNDGFGHGGHVDNCVTHARDGWCYFTGEYYELGCLLHSPKELLRKVGRRHPEMAR